MVSLSWLPSTPLCVSSDVSWKWAFKRKRLKNFSVSSFTWNSAVTIACEAPDAFPVVDWREATTGNASGASQATVTDVVGIKLPYSP